MTQAEQVVPWYEDGEDYGRDLGTGAVDADGNEPGHVVDVPREYDGPEPVTADEEQPPVQLPPPSVPTHPGGHNELDGNPPSAPEGGNG